MDELPLVWREAGEPVLHGGIDADHYKYYIELFYLLRDNDYLLGWAKREFGKGYIVHLSWRVTDEDVEILGRTRTLAEAKELLTGYVYAWWVTPGAERMRNSLKGMYEKHLHRMSRKFRPDSPA